MIVSKKKKEILEVSKDLFYTKGFAETSMRDLAAHLQIKAASLYSHFRSKDDILETICDEVYNGMLEVMELVENGSLTVEDRFNLFVKLHIVYSVQKGKSAQIYNKYWMYSADNKDKYGKINAEYFEMIKGLVKERFPNEIEKDCFIPNATAIFLMQTLSSVPKLINPENPNLDCVVEDVKYRLIYGFKKDL